MRISQVPRISHCWSGPKDQLGHLDQSGSVGTKDFQVRSGPEDQSCPLVGGHTRVEHAHVSCSKVLMCSSFHFFPMDLFSHPLFIDFTSSQLYNINEWP